MSKYINAYGRTYHYYGTFLKYSDMKRRVYKLRQKGKKTFIRKVIKGYLFPVVKYEIYTTRR